MAEKEEQRVAIRPFRTRGSLWDLREEMDRLWEGVPAFPRFRRMIEEQAWPAVDISTGTALSSSRLTFPE
jgi:hypothetical protein